MSFVDAVADALDRLNLSNGEHVEIQTKHGSVHVFAHKNRTRILIDDNGGEVELDDHQWGLTIKGE